MANRSIEIIQTKIDIPTILVEHEGRMLPIHSKYNPIAEAERFIDSLTEEIEKSDHLFFYGVGLGYHVKIAQERYSEKVFSVYEPIEQVSDQFVNLANVTGVRLNDLTKNYVELSTDNIIANIADFSSYFAHRILLITLPVYEKLVPNEVQQFNEAYKKVYKEKVGSKQTDKRFGERWAINMIMNVKHTFSTPNILMQDNNIFEGKPVILVAAGPSLSDEIENLKQIKERGLAYIFAVGSANRALLKHDILPDALLSYDPQGTNWHVFEELMDRNIDTIPLIFGTTVGHETVDYYPGPKTHVVISNDRLTSYLHAGEMVTVNDSSTISNVTFQILQKLNVSKVILVGQNFAYRDNQFYASGIKRYDELSQQETDGKLREIEIEKSFYVEDVFGNKVRTNITFDTMRKEMEYYLNINQDLVVVNTTKGGAKIEGAPFVSLDELLQNELVESFVQHDWFKQLHLPKTELQQKRIKKLENENKKFMELFEGIETGFKRLKEQSNSKDVQKLDRILVKNGKLVDKLHGNLIYKLFIKALANLHTEQIYANIKLCDKIKDLNMKVERIIEIYEHYLFIILKAYKLTIPILQVNTILKLANLNLLKFYEATSGVFNYEGEWKKNILSHKEDKNKSRSNIYGIGIGINNSKGGMEFKFRGEMFQLIGTNTGKEPVKLLITVDGKSKQIMVIDFIETKKYGNFHSNIIYEAKKLPNDTHHVKLEMLSEGSINFLGVKINNNGRVYHINEVEKLEHTKVGSKILCSYKAEKNKVGYFYDLGVDNNFIPISSSIRPSGSFYLNIVEVNGNRIKAIADRNIQNYISWQTLGGEVKVPKENKVNQLVSWRLVKSSIENEWDQYIITNNYKFEWNTDLFIASWMDEIEPNTGRVPRRTSIENYEYVLNDASNIHSSGYYNGFRPVFILERF